jgi:NTE family protein
MAASRKGKTALVLAGGGVSGVAYEVGALRALDHVFTNHTVNDFDLYVGTSAGAIVAASVAGGMPPIMLAGLMAGTVPGFGRLSRLSLYRPNIGETLHRLMGAPRLIREAAVDYWRFRDQVPLTEALYSLAPLLPSGIFTNDGLLNYITETFETAGLSDDFLDIPKELHLIATDVETLRRVDFSKGTSPNVPISMAVAASTCIPILFRPVEIEGHHYVDGGVKGQAAIDVAINRGARLIVIVNGLVPLDTEAIAGRAGVDKASRSIFELGMRAIGNQVIRGMLHDSLIDHLKALRDRNPEVDFILIEPRPDDEKMFFHEVLSFSAQMIVLQHGYETVINGLSRSRPHLSRILSSHGIEITRKIGDIKPLEVPVAEMETHGRSLGRLFKTVLDRGSGADAARDGRALVTPQAAVAPARAARKPAAKRAVKPPAVRTLRASAGRGNAPPRGTFRPRVISSD